MTPAVTASPIPKQEMTYYFDLGVVRCETGVE